MRHYSAAHPLAQPSVHQPQRPTGRFSSSKPCVARAIYIATAGPLHPYLLSIDTNPVTPVRSQPKQGKAASIDSKAPFQCTASLRASLRRLRRPPTHSSPFTSGSQDDTTSPINIPIRMMQVKYLVAPSLTPLRCPIVTPSRFLLQGARQEELLKGRTRELVDLGAVRRDLVRDEQGLHAVRRFELVFRAYST